jgi:hypothetical protein
MAWFENRKLMLAVGGGFALFAGIGIAVTIMMIDHGSHAPPPASRGGLVVEMGQVDDAPSSNTKPLRCFVGGQFVGIATLAECARKNGVSTQALDVGLDANGALTAADQAGLVVTPLPEVPVAPPPPPPGTETAAGSAQPITGQARPGQGACLAYDQGEWHKLAENLSPTACAQMLFSSRCDKTGATAFGRTGDQTLKYTGGKVEISSDNKTYRALVDQVATNCPEH